MMRRAYLTVVVALAVCSLATPSRAAFHVTVIDEVMTSYNGDAGVQFIEMRMLAGLQSFVANSVLAAFDANGNYVADILVVPNNVTNSGIGVRWLVGTAGFQTQSGITPDFVMPAGILPTGGGMVCYGGGGGLVPKNPPNWSRTDFSTYVDCLAYGTYSGPTNVKIGTPTTLNGDGHSLQRGTTTSNNAADFSCADPATPENNSGDKGSMPATSPCGASGATPTPTVVATPPTETPTGVSSGTATATVPPSGCVGDCNGNGMVEINELIIGVNIALGIAPLSTCPSFDANKDGMVEINELIQAVSNALNGCAT
jgi:hypothetical protein